MPIENDASIMGTYLA